VTVLSAGATSEKEALMQIRQNRRHFLASASLAAAAGVLGARGSLADEGPPETTTIRLARIPAICVAPGYIADALLRAEGFTDIQYLPISHGNAVARGEIDFHLETAAWVASNIDAGEPITALAGVHGGCYELFAHDPIRSVTDLKDRRVGVPQTLGSSGHLLLASMAAYVGLDPHDDVDWVTSDSGDFLEEFVEVGSTPFSGSHPSRRSCATARSVGSSSARPRTSPGPITSAARRTADGTSSTRIRSPPSATCAPSSRLPISVPPSRSRPRNS
jgi:NitT/TauT family transport system substrate-binding protein